MPPFSEAYIAHLTRGPFPEQIDLWAESGRYFHQLHSEIISHLLAQIREPLLQLGYVAGRETSLQIAENSQPDIYIQKQVTTPEKKRWDYSGAAETVMAVPGVEIEGLSPELDALYIKNLQTAQLVTIVELISPRNKTELSLMEEYLRRRENLRRNAVHVVEIDLTRSVKRLVQDSLVETYPYHVAIHLYDQTPRFIGIEWGKPLPRCAIPLKEEVIAIELQAAYNHAYIQTTLAAHIHNETHYHENSLPFPSLIPPQIREEALNRVRVWQDRLKALMENE